MLMYLNVNFNLDFVALWAVKLPGPLLKVSIRMNLVLIRTVKMEQTVLRM